MSDDLKNLLAQFKLLDQEMPVYVEPHPAHVFLANIKVEAEKKTTSESAFAAVMQEYSEMIESFCGFY